MGNGNKVLRRSAGMAPVGLVVVAAIALSACSGGEKARAQSLEPAAMVTVGVAPATLKPMQNELTLSSELVPFQDIDVYAKVSGFVRELFVDYGSRVKKGQVMANLEIPELEMQLQQDQAAIKNMTDQVTHAENEVSRVKAQHKVAHLQFNRLHDVSKAKPGLVAQQEVDDAEGRDLAREAQVEAAKSALDAAHSELAVAQARKQRDQVLYDYSHITAPFDGIVTQRYANLGTLMQAGTNSSTQAMPLVKLAEEDRYRLVIPVPESYVRYIRIGDPVNVHVPSLLRTFPGRVARFSVDVKEDTRTMHTEVDVPNPSGVLIPGVYAEATIALDRKDRALAIPLQAVSQEGDQTSVYVVNAANKIEDRKITLGLRTSTEAEVLSGLSPGEKVVVSDRGSLKPGQEVRPQPVEVVEYQAPK